MMLKLKQIAFRVSLEGERAINSRFGSSRGAGSPRQTMGAALLYIGAIPETEIAIAAFTLWQRALQIASRRKENNIRDYDAVAAKYESELLEFEQAVRDSRQRTATYPFVRLTGRLSNLLYYSVQLYAHDGNLERFQLRCQHHCAIIGIPVRIAFLVACEKFGSRGDRAEQGLPALKPHEETCMQQVLDDWTR